MTDTTPALSRWQVWIAYLPFADSPKKGKARPVLLLDKLQNGTLMVLKITSKDIRGAYSGIKIPEGSEKLELKKESYIQIEPVFNIAISNLSNVYLGTLSKDLQAEVTKLLFGSANN